MQLLQRIALVPLSQHTHARARTRTQCVRMPPCNEYAAARPLMGATSVAQHRQHSYHTPGGVRRQPALRVPDKSSYARAPLQFRAQPQLGQLVCAMRMGMEV